MAEMQKMQHSYGAPIDSEEIKLLGIYLTVAYGDASSVNADDRKLKLPPATQRDRRQGTSASSWRPAVGARSR